MVHWPATFGHCPPLPLLPQAGTSAAVSVSKAISQLELNFIAILLESGCGESPGKEYTHAASRGAGNGFSSPFARSLMG
jgi:hypothetical protein